MSWFFVSQLLAFCASIFLVVGVYHQAWKLWRTKSVDDFTPTIVIALFLNEFFWLNYGIQLKEWPIVVIPTTSIPAATAIVVGYFKFRTKGNHGNRTTSENSRP